MIPQFGQPNPMGGGDWSNLGVNLPGVKAGAICPRCVVMWVLIALAVWWAYRRLR